MKQFKSLFILGLLQAATEAVHIAKGGLEEIHEGHEGEASLVVDSDTGDLTLVLDQDDFKQLQDTTDSAFVASPIIDDKKDVKVGGTSTADVVVPKEPSGSSNQPANIDQAIAQAYQELAMKQLAAQIAA